MKHLLLPGAWLLALALTACGPKPEEVCDCIRQSANDFMLKGERPSEAKLLAPCAEMMTKLKDDQAAKVKIEADYEDVKKALEAKTLLAVAGKTPAFPPLAVEFDSVMADYGKDYEAATYRYQNRAATTTITGLLQALDSTAMGYEANCSPIRTDRAGKDEVANTRVKIPVSAAVRQTLAAPASEVVFDRKRHRSIKFDDRWFDTELSGTHTYYGSVGIPDTYKSRSSEAYRLEEFLKVENNDIFALLAEKAQSAYQPEQYAQMLAEVRAGNYVLLDARKGVDGSKYSVGNFYFNKLTAKGELVLEGKNGYGLPSFSLKNVIIVKNEDLLPTLLAAKNSPG